MNVFVADEQAVPVNGAELRALALHVLEQEGYPSATEASIFFVTDEQMAGYNERFLQREGPTDVLAFPLEELVPGRAPVVAADGPPLTVGDVFIAPNHVRTQAADRGGRFEQEMELMVVHGLLHLLGYDHQDDEEAETMESRERRLLAERRRS